METVLLFSNHKKVFEVTERIIKERYKLIWCIYELLEKNQYPYADVVIMHFDEEILKKGTFELIVKVKGKLGHTVPILAFIESGTLQDIFSILETGVFDYIETIEDQQKYRKKIDEIISWNWYLKKYRPDKKQ
ncbi:MAG: hypothetical protein HFH67_09455 [Lachnospiraceae bacterium]|nr:hypothetical protein [Lachnospiraceae bacterium]